ncbi:MAG: hypothetical protein U0795_23220 [Pirellulales bacterium]
MVRSIFKVGGFGAIVVAAILVLTASAYPQGSPKTSGQYGKGFWENQRVSRNLRHAREYSQGLYRYQRSVPQVQPEVIRSESVQLGQNIDNARKQVAVLKQGHGDNKDVADSITAIEQHLAAAAEQHKVLHEECQKDKMDVSKGMDCCNMITKELDKAIAEHAALMRKLNLDVGDQAEAHHPAGADPKSTPQ